ncbi:hypothetical protein PFISCL1PPCAC_26131, partial [Pristionchus fissidentatus]
SYSEMASLRLLLCFALLSSVASAWSFEEWAANELLPRTRDLVRRHMVGSRMFLTEPKKEIDLPEGETEFVKKEEKSLEKSNSSSSSSSSSSEEKKVPVKKEEVVAVTTQQPSSSSSSPSSTASPTTTASPVAKKSTEEELAGKIVDVAEVLRSIVDKKDGKKDKSIAEVKLEKKLEKMPLIKETKVDGGVAVEKLRKTTSPSSVLPTGAPSAEVVKPVAQYRRVSCDMCLKAFQGLNYNVVQMKKVAEDMVVKDCESLLYGDEEAIEACVEVMLRKIDEYYNKFEPMIQTNKACVRLGMCAAHLVTNQVPQ